MIKKTLSFVALSIFIICLTQTSLYAQSSSTTISLKKGEVLDILLLTQSTNDKNLLNTYFKTAFPVAERLSYQSLKGFKVTKHTQGNMRPDNLIIAKWANLNKRETFLRQIIKEVPDFHEQRRNIWSYFGLEYFEIPENISFELINNHHHVATAFWFKVTDQESQYMKKWERKIRAMGGALHIRLQDGVSPFGYKYNPTYFFITSWKDDASFNAFQKYMKKIEVDNIVHINEFILD